MLQSLFSVEPCVLGALYNTTIGATKRSKDHTNTITMNIKMKIDALYWPQYKTM